MKDIRLTRRTEFLDQENDDVFVGPDTYRLPNHVAERYLERSCWELAEGDGDDEEPSGDADGGEATPSVDRFDPTKSGSENAPEPSDVEAGAVEETVVKTEVVESDDEDDEMPDVDLDEFLTNNAKTVRNAVRDGRFDGELETLRSIEDATQGRKTVLEAIDGRMDEE